MREVKNFQQAQIIINDLLNWRTQFETKPWDRQQLKFTNNPVGTDANDLVIVSQLPPPVPPTTPKDQHFAIPWSDGGTAVTGAVIPAYIVMDERTGIPLQVGLYSVVAPSTAPFTINLKINGTTMLSLALTIPIGQNGPKFSGNFNSPLPYIGQSSVIVPQIISGGAAQGWSIFLSVKRTKQK